MQRYFRFRDPKVSVATLRLSDSVRSGSDRPDHVEKSELGDSGHSRHATSGQHKAAAERLQPQRRQRMHFNSSACSLSSLLSARISARVSSRFAPMWALTDARALASYARNRHQASARHPRRLLDVAIEGLGHGHQLGSLVFEHLGHVVSSGIGSLMLRCAKARSEAISYSALPVSGPKAALSDGGAK
jgi:hypothetical protein